MATLLLGYDTEYLQDPEFSLRAVNAIVKVHRKYDAPATFFIVGKLLEAKGSEFREVLDQDLFDIQSHTYSHKLLKDNKIAGRRPNLKVVKHEIRKATRLIEETFGIDVLGLRAPYGHYKGLQGEKAVLKIIYDDGIRFVSSDSRAFHDTLPAPFNQPYWYDEDGFPEILEIPVQDWHDTALKGYGRDAVAWPLTLPWAIPERPPQTPEEEFAVYEKSLSHAAENNLIFCPAFHPWSMYRFNPEAKTIELILKYAEENNFEIMTYLDLYRKLSRRRH